MIRLLTDTPNQNAYLTLDEARQYFSTPFTHYLFILRHEENSAAGVYLAQVLDVIAENQRITQVAIDTTGLTLIGRYRYDVYGQNSASNLNPDDETVVGLCEQGLCELRDDRSFFTVPDIDINNDIVFNGQ
jgi:hypothetical protein